MVCHDEPSPIIVPEAEAWEVRRLTWFMSQRNPARRAADALLNGEAPSPASATDLVGQLRGFGALRWTECPVAAWALGFARLDSAERSSVVSLLSTLVNSRPQRDLGCMMLTFALWFTPIPWMWVLGVNIRDSRVNRIRAAAAGAVGRLASPFSIPSLAAALAANGGVSSGNERVRQAAASALHPTLAALTEEHYGLMPPETVMHLCSILNLAGEPLALAVLQALGKAGTGAALDRVRRELYSSSLARREAAGRILPILESRLRNEMAAATLLRAATAPGPPEEVLLRPALGAPTGEESLPLRPVEDT